MLAGTLVIGVIIKATGHLGDHQTLKGLVKECLAAIFYVYNLVFPIHNGPWIDHLWTLSIEEQFYLAIGVVALVLIARGAVRLTAVLLGVLIVIIELSRLFFFAGPLGVAAAAVWTQRPDSLMVGMLAAIASASIADPMSDRAKRALGAAGWVATAVLFFSVWASTGVMAKLGWDHPFVPKNFADLLESGTRPKGIYWMQWGHTAAAWSMAVITLCAFRLSDWWPNKFLSLKPLVWIGGILSYALYLWHVPIQELMHALLGPLPRPVWVVLAVIVPFVAAYPTYVFVEKRALAIKNRFAVEPPSAQTAPGAGVA
jgi:peptidoglycan/LPS O-acetylase OafA/YrhL